LNPSFRKAEAESAVARRRLPLVGEEVDHQQHRHQREDDVQQLVGQVEILAGAL
jgi:hypothetical protein